MHHLLGSQTEAWDMGRRNGFRAWSCEKGGTRGARGWASRGGKGKKILGDGFNFSIWTWRFGVCSPWFFHFVVASAFLLFLFVPGSPLPGSVLCHQRVCPGLTLRASSHIGLLNFRSASINFGLVQRKRGTSDLKYGQTHRFGEVNCLNHCKTNHSATFNVKTTDTNVESASKCAWTFITRVHTTQRVVVRK